jgi:hypothetical protein
VAVTDGSGSYSMAICSAASLERWRSSQLVQPSRGRAGNGVLHRA